MESGLSAHVGETDGDITRLGDISDPGERWIL